VAAQTGGTQEQLVRAGGLSPSHTSCVHLRVVWVGGLAGLVNAEERLAQTHASRTEELKKGAVQLEQ